MESPIVYFLAWLGDAYVVKPRQSAKVGLEPAASGDNVTPAVELLSDSPVLVTGVHGYQPDARPFGQYTGQGATAVYPLFPIHLWEKAPIETGIFKPGMPSQQYNPDSGGEPNTIPLFPSRTIVVAASDDTTISMPIPDGTTKVLALQRGDVFSHDSNDAMIGQAVVASHAIDIVSFAPNATIPWDFPDGPEPDGTRTFQPSMPLRLWGSEYVAVRHGDRWDGMPEEPPWRIIGGADDTTLSYEPYHPVGAPDRVKRGELAVFFADAPFVVRSQDPQHSFFFGGHMTGAEYQKQRFGSKGFNEDLRGRALVVHQVATSLWMRRYPFFAITRFAEQSLVVVRKAGGKDVRLDCAGVIAGWQPVGAGFEFTRVALTGHLFEPIVNAAGTCQTGSHVIESEDPFWATLWAWGNHETVTQLGLGSDGAYALPLFGVATPPADQPTH
jgi:hypothetical protein